MEVCALLARGQVSGFEKVPFEWSPCRSECTRHCVGRGFLPRDAGQKPKAEQARPGHTKRTGCRA